MTGDHVSVATGIQELPFPGQVLVLLDVATGRTETGRAAPGDVLVLFDDLGLPRPANIGSVLSVLEKRGHVSRTKGTGSVWRLSPAGKKERLRLVDDFDVAELTAEAKSGGAPLFGTAIHAVLPPTLAPPELLAPVAAFLVKHPFETNVFGMTRFPDEDIADPVESAIDRTRAACEMHGLEFHLASDRAISDDLWANVAGHMWACRYGIAFFEDSAGKGLNYNLTIEVGSMLMAGRRVALLADKSIPKMPTDLVGKIYRSVDLTRPKTVEREVHRWASKDLALGDCASCL